MKRHFAIASLLPAVYCFITLAGCATSNPINSYYVSYVPDVTPEVAELILEPPSKSPRVISSSNFVDDIISLRKEGYIAIGASEFTWSRVPTEAQILKKASEVRADMVLYSSKYDHTETGVTTALGVIPGTSSTTTTSGHASAYGSGSYSASAYGSGGYAYGTGSYSGSAHGSYYGSTTTTTDPQLYTYNVPYTAHVYYYGIVFFRKAKPPILGAHNVVLDDETRKSLGRNTGAKVTVVVNNSPAFVSNIMPNDVITQIGQYAVNSPDDLGAALGALAGTNTSLTYIRGGTEYTVGVKLNPMPTAASAP